MAVKTPFTQQDFASILSQYDLGTYTQSEAVRQGTVQTNFFIQTTQGKFVFTRCSSFLNVESVEAEYQYPEPVGFVKTEYDLFAEDKE